jgi:uncharacterized protein DUF397
MSTSDLTNARWRRSSFTNNGGGNCVEIALVEPAAAIRDSKNRGGGTLLIGDHAWQQLRLSVR